MIEKLVQTIAELLPDLLRGKVDARDAVTADDDLFRGALFKEVITTSGTAIPAIDAFFDSLTASCARGDVGACRDIRRITQHRQQQDSAAENIGRENSPLAAAMRKQERLAAVAHLFGGLAYLAMLPAMKKQAEETYGPFQLQSGMVPFGLDLEPAREAVASYARRKRRQWPKGDYEVGFCKPPARTRFTAENNPARKRKVGSAWDAFDRSLHKPVTLTRSNGEKTISTRLRASYDSLIRKAIAGDRAARTEVIRQILVLSGKGMLSAPRKSRRTRRKPFSEELRQRLREVIVLIVNRLARETSQLFAANLGSKPGVVDYEYAAKVENERQDKQGGTCDQDTSAQTGIVTGAEPVNAKRTRLRGATQAPAALKKTRPASLQSKKPNPAREAVEPNASTLVIPTRTQTRAVPPARNKPAASATSAYPTLPRAKMPVIVSSAAKKPKAGTPGRKPRG